MTRVLVVGDVMLDRFVYGDVERVSPEAPSLILRERRQTASLGGAANVAAGITALKASCTLFGVIGYDEDGSLLERTCKMANIDSQLWADPLRSTTVKTRFVSIEHPTHLLRLDRETDSPISENTLGALQRQIERLPPTDNAVILSDYGKGVVHPAIIRAAIEHANKTGIPVLVDPKQQDFTLYRDAWVLKPNLREMGLPHDASNDDIIAAAVSITHRGNVRSVLVTCGDRGMIFVKPGTPVIYMPAHPVKVRDVSGAGDTVIATLAVMLAENRPMTEAVNIANQAAAIAVSKSGTASVSRVELFGGGKVVPDDNWALLDQRVTEWRAEGLRIGFTSGCFDLIHPGHVKLLQEARATCDRLIVGLNSDGSVRALKGPRRPVQTQSARAAVLAALDTVDLVAIFDELTPLTLAQHITPDVVIKGADYRGQPMPESDAARETVFVDLVPDQSTTRLIEAAV